MHACTLEIIMYFHAMYSEAHAYAFRRSKQYEYISVTSVTALFSVDVNLDFFSISSVECQIRLILVPRLTISSILTVRFILELYADFAQDKNPAVSSSLIDIETL